MFTDGAFLAKCFVCAFFGVLFLQSGIDKVTDRNGNLEWLTPHFANSPFKNMVPGLLTLITLLEILTGVAAAVAVVMLLVDRATLVPVVAMALACVSLVCLFAGQRLAKDYAGAATIAAYFAVALIGLLVVSSTRS
jgi:uncharacterized membrane protein YphA (DoxX/SURF4 family)